MRLRLSDHARITVNYSDDSPYGSGVTGLVDRLIHATCRDTCAADSESGSGSRRALERCFGDAALGQLYRRPGVLRDECLYPDPSAVQPVSLSVEMDSDRHLPVPVDRCLVQDLAGWLSDWTEPASRPSASAPRRLWDALAETGALVDEPTLALVERDGLTFVGHATMLVRSGGASILLDPFLLPRTREDASDYRPRVPSEVRPDAVLITHSHPDHFDLGSLLRLGRDLPIYVPAVPRESILAVDMATRLTELGFRHVHTMAWDETQAIAGMRVTAYPFYGEQPTDAEVLHPEARNLGNTYLVDTGQLRVVFLADAGADSLGSTIAMAAARRARDGAVDVVCGGYRAWRLYPAQYTFTSVPRYMLFVPPHLWGTRIQLMNDASDLLATTKAWGGRWSVPYANGGAPWYWQRGLGPNCESAVSPDDADFDPALSILAGQDQDASGPTVAALHPGEQLQWSASGQATRAAWPGLSWPFDDHAIHELRARLPTEHMESRDARR